MTEELPTQRGEIEHSCLPHQTTLPFTESCSCR